jgi:transcriptional antiterminator NusG
MVLTDDVNEQWCILRTAGRQTLKLAETLASDGFEVWTPRETRTIRKPRMNVKRDVVLPIMPSYVFAKAEHLVDLLQMSKMDVKPRRGSGWGKPAHASFSVMRYRESIPLIADRDLTSLRRLERKAELDRLRIMKTEPFAKGVTVRVMDGSHDAWGGMTGRVTMSDATHSRVIFSGSRIEVKIRTSLLSLDGIEASSPHCGTAARKAA